MRENLVGLWLLAAGLTKTVRWPIAELSSLPHKGVGEIVDSSHSHLSKSV